jgi:DNA-binding response OmpR family regulator
VSTPLTTQPTILVCDDEAHIRHIIAYKLRGAGFGVLEAKNGHDAMTMLADPSVPTPSIVITDFQMPIVSGVELAKFLKRTPATSDTPVLMLTARGYVLTDEDLVSTNIRQVISKPFGVKQLLDRILHILGSGPALAQAAA